jgi:hypothetical protein
MNKPEALITYRSALASFLFMLAGALSISAQTAERANEFAIWGGASVHSAQVAGTADHTKLGLVGLRYARQLTGGKTATLKYTVDVIPVAVLSFPLRQFPSPLGLPFEQGDRTVYSAGTAPIGLQVNFRPRRKVQPFVGLSGGCLYFTRNIPNELGKRFNFTADIGGGFQYFYQSHKALTFGYKLHHISNAERGDINPGFDSNVIYLGFSFFK